MGTKVDGTCIKCKNDYIYIFGVIPELNPIITFLKYYVAEQKDFFVKENFDNLVRKNLKDDAEFMSESEENKKEITEKVFKYINDFFNDEEKQKLKTKILLSFEVEIYPYVNIMQRSEDRKVMNLPLLQLNFLDGEKYLRVYKPLRYITFTDDKKFLLCPKDLENIVAFKGEEKV